MEALVTGRPERRGAPRVSFGSGGPTARIRPGHRGAVLNLSLVGALIETTHRLTPGAAVDLQLDLDGRHLSLRGGIVRCAVTRLRDGDIWYAGAVAFDERLPSIGERGPDGYHVPVAESPASRTRREDASRPAG